MESYDFWFSSKSSNILSGRMGEEEGGKRSEATSLHVIAALS
jgi:hypothetical protein